MNPLILTVPLDCESWHSPRTSWWVHWNYRSSRGQAVRKTSPHMKPWRISYEDLCKWGWRKQ